MKKALNTFILLALVVLTASKCDEKTEEDNTPVRPQSGEYLRFSMGTSVWEGVKNAALPELYAKYGPTETGSFLDITACTDPLDQPVDVLKKHLYMHANRDNSGQITYFTITYYEDKSTSSSYFGLCMQSISGTVTVVKESESAISISYKGKFMNILEESDQRDVEIYLQDIPKSLTK
jgi:hypothetical protein